MLAILIFAWTYVLILLYDMMASRNIYQAILLQVYTITIIILLLLQDDQTKTSTLLHITPQLRQRAKPLMIANASVTALLFFLQVYLTVQLRKTFSGEIFKRFDADLRLRKRFRWVEVCRHLWHRDMLNHEADIETMQLYLALMKLDFYFLLVSPVASLVILKDQNPIESALSGASLGIGALFIFMAPAMVKHEKLLPCGIMMVCQSEHLLTCLLTRL